MAKEFNITALCIPEEHYMVNIDGRLREIKGLVDSGRYFTLNRARQYGKTTTLMALEEYLKGDYYIISMDFQTFGEAEFQDENKFAISFADSFWQLLKENRPVPITEVGELLDRMENNVLESNVHYTLKPLFEDLSSICAGLDKPLVLIIDEVDSAASNQVFLDFLAQIRAYYIRSFKKKTFQSVILAGVYDVKNLKHKIPAQEDYKVNSPWNTATDFNVDMSFGKADIAGMLKEYEQDYQTGMNVDEMSELLYDYTAGHPFLASRLCKLMDEEVNQGVGFSSRSAAWTKEGFHQALRMILSEKNALFESLTGKIKDYQELNSMMQSLLFTGKSIAYNADDSAIDIATMFGFIKNQHGIVAIANRIFEIRLYNAYPSSAKMQELDIYKESLKDKSQFIVNGHLNMGLILEKFVIHFNDLYGDRKLLYRIKDKRIEAN